MAKEKKQSAFSEVFTVELFGMALVLFCLLSFLCLVSGDAVFGEPGLAVRSFYLGVFGFLAFPFLIIAGFFGIKGVTGFKIKNAAVKAVFFYALIYALFALMIFQTAATDFSGKDFGEYLSGCYQSGISFNGATPGGAFIGMFAYLPVSLIGKIGSYIFCSLAVLGVTAWIFRTPISQLFEDGKVNKARKAKKEYVKKEKKVAPAVRGDENATADRDMTSDEARDGRGAEEERRGGLHIADEDFGVMTERDKRKKEREYSLRVLFDEKGDKGSGDFDKTENPIMNSYPRSYQQQYEADMNDKTDYIRRPYDPRGFRVSSPMGDTRDEEILRGSGSAKKMDVDVSEPEKDIYVINPGGRERPGINSFDRASGRGTDAEREGSGRSDFLRGGLNGGDEYNKDRFVYPGREESRRGSSRAENDFDRGLGRTDRTDRTDNDSARGFARDSSMRGGREDLSSRERTDRTFGSRDFGRADESRISPDGYRRSEDLSRLNRARNGATTGGDYDKDGLDERENLGLSGRRNRPDADALRGGERERGFSRDKNEADGIDSVKRDNAAEPKRTGDTPVSPSDAGRSERQSDEKTFSEKSVRPEPEVKAEFVKEEPDRQPVQGTTKRGFQISMADLSEDRKLENPIDNIPKKYKYHFPDRDLLNDYTPKPEVLMRIQKEQESRCETILSIINSTSGGPKAVPIGAEIVDVCIGPAITRFELTIPSTVSTKRVLEKYEDLNFWLKSKEKIRMLAPIPGTSRIGIEVPNSDLMAVGLRSLLESNEFKTAKKGSMCFGLGKDLVGRPVVSDIAKMPHLMVAGATGTGKSVFLNTLLISLVYKYSPEDLRIILVDPKFVEFSMFRGMPNLMFNEIFNDAKKTCAMLDWAVGEMERRYQMFLKYSSRDIDEYNANASKNGEKVLFKILIIIDEFADLMSRQEDRKNMENAIGRLAAKARAAGIHLILATQRPSADIVDGSIKTNFTSRIAFKMSSMTDAMVVMGEGGAEKLLGSGDMLYRLGKMTLSERAQGAFISGEEVNRVCEYVKNNNECYYDEFALEDIRKKTEMSEAPAVDSASSGDAPPANIRNDDDLIKEAMRIAITSDSVSISMLQRKLGLGYPKAGKVVDMLEKKGYVSAAVDNKARKVLMTRADFEQEFGEPVDPLDGIA